MTKTDAPIATSLLDWYDNHSRDLPWRVSPQDRAGGVWPDPYRVWLSEIMLQQTTVATVKSYFEKSINIWPTITDLAAASEDEVLRAWAGLGYYSRARNLKKCADIIVRDHGGMFPQTAAELRKLPGIGDYTSAAIAAITFDEPAAVMDGNVERVFSRLFAIDTPLPAAKPLIKSKVQEVLSLHRPGDFAQATMDLGATICSPKKPSCLHCPLRENCQALAKHDPETFPVKAPKKEKPMRAGAAFVIMREDGAVLLEKRGSAGLLANMTQVPTTAWNARQDGETTIKASPIPNGEWQHCGTIDHVFTHFSLRLTVWRTHSEILSLADHQWWSRQDELIQEALPTVMKKAIQAALEA